MEQENGLGNMSSEIINHNFIIGPTDTDSISYCKNDMSSFSPEELKSLLDELNDISPEYMEWEDDGYYLSCICLKAKNYILWDGKKKSIKGSAFKTSSKEIACAEMMQEIVDEMLNSNSHDNITTIYIKYLKEALNVKDISRWSQKKTVTSSVLKCADPDETVRKNEKDIWDAIKNENDRQEGNKILLYPVILGYDVKPGGVSEKTGKPLKDKVKEVTGLKLAKYWSNDHDVLKLVDRVYNTLKIFKTVLDMDQYLDYTAKKNLKLLEELKHEVVSEER